MVLVADVKDLVSTKIFYMANPYLWNNNRLRLFIHNHMVLYSGQLAYERRDNERSYLQKVTRQLDNRL